VIHYSALIRTSKTRDARLFLTIAICFLFGKSWWAMQGSNIRRPAAHLTAALAARLRFSPMGPNWVLEPEIHQQKERPPSPMSPLFQLVVDGGARRNRTDDLFNAIEALSQLSYGPVFQNLVIAASIGAKRASFSGAGV
jgi:hypothetical protein